MSSRNTKNSSPYSRKNYNTTYMNNNKKYYSSPKPSSIKHTSSSEKIVLTSTKERRKSISSNSSTTIITYPISNPIRYVLNQLSRSKRLSPQAQQFINLLQDKYLNYLVRLETIFMKSRVFQSFTQFLNISKENALRVSAILTVITFIYGLNRLWVRHKRLLSDTFVYGLPVYSILQLLKMDIVTTTMSTPSSTITTNPAQITTATPTTSSQDTLQHSEMDDSSTSSETYMGDNTATNINVNINSTASVVNTRRRATFNSEFNKSQQYKQWLTFLMINAIFSLTDELLMPKSPSPSKSNVTVITKTTTSNPYLLRRKVKPQIVSNVTTIQKAPLSIRLSNLLKSNAVGSCYWIFKMAFTYWMVYKDGRKTVYYHIIFPIIKKYREMQMRSRRFVSELDICYEENYHSLPKSYPNINKVHPESSRSTPDQNHSPILHYLDEEDHVNSNHHHTSPNLNPNYYHPKASANTRDQSSPNTTNILLTSTPNRANGNELKEVSFNESPMYPQLNEMENNDIPVKLSNNYYLYENNNDYKMKEEKKKMDNVPYHLDDHKKIITESVEKLTKYYNSPSSLDLGETN